MNQGNYNPTSQAANHRMIFIALLCFAAFALLPNMAHAAPLPWEGFTSQLACTLSGPWVKWMAVIAIALGGVMFGLGELSGPFQKMMQIAGGFSVAVGATVVVGWLLPTAGGSGGLTC